MSNLSKSSTAEACTPDARPEPVGMWWNFVARSSEEIAAARLDWEQHERFGNVAAYRGSGLPAPEFIGRPIRSS